MDLDHPQYRRTAAPEEKLGLEPGIEDVTAEGTNEQEQ